MDNIYQSIKEFLKSFINLFLAVVDLFTSLINGLASLLGKLRPHISGKYTELKKEAENVNIKDSLKAAKRNGYSLDFKGYETGLVEEIRSELKQKVTSKERYYYLKACVTNNGTGFYAILLSVLVFVQAGTIILCGVGSYGEQKLLAVVVMAAFCVAACIVIARHQKKLVRNRLMQQILEEEFADKTWQMESQADADTKLEQVIDAGKEAEKAEPEKGREIAKIQSINVVSKEEIG